jgi:hypothetical protein
MYTLSGKPSKARDWNGLSQDCMDHSVATEKRPLCQSCVKWTQGVRKLFLLPQYSTNEPAFIEGVVSMLPSTLAAWEGHAPH